MSFFLLLLITVGNLALGFGLAVHLGFGPDFSHVASYWNELRNSSWAKKRDDTKSQADR